MSIVFQAKAGIRAMEATVTRATVTRATATVDTPADTAADTAAMTTLHILDTAADMTTARVSVQNRLRVRFVSLHFTENSQQLSRIFYFEML